VRRGGRVEQEKTKQQTCNRLLIISLCWLPHSICLKSPTLFLSYASGSNMSKSLRFIPPPDRTPPPLKVFAVVTPEGVGMTEGRNDGATNPGNVVPPYPGGGFRVNKFVGAGGGRPVTVDVAHIPSLPLIPPPIVWDIPTAEFNESIVLILDRRGCKPIAVIEGVNDMDMVVAGVEFVSAPSSLLAFVNQNGGSTTGVAVMTTGAANPPAPTILPINVGGGERITCA